MNEVNHFLDYMSNYPHYVILYYKLYMIMKIHASASYLTESKGFSRVCVHYFLRILPKSGKPIILNRSIQKIFRVIKHDTASTAEAKLVGILSNTRIKKDSTHLTRNL